MNKRDFLKTGLIAAAASTLPSISYSEDEVVCLMHSSEMSVESTDSPFFQHFHQLTLPVRALIELPKDGIIVKTSSVDQGSYDVAGFDKFIKSSGLNADLLRKHDHSIQINRNQLLQIAQGQKNVEIRVISKSGNYVHNFLITASPMVLAKVRRGSR